MADDTEDGTNTADKPDVNYSPYGPYQSGYTVPPNTRSNTPSGNGNGFDPKSLIPLAALAPMLYAMFKGPQQQQIGQGIPGFNQALQQSLTTQNQLAPLRGAAMNTAAGMLPNRAWAGYNAFSPQFQAQVTPGASPTSGGPSGGSDGPGLLSTMLALLGGGAGGFLLGHQNSQGQSGLDALMKLLGLGGKGNSGGPSGSGNGPGISWSKPLFGNGSDNSNNGAMLPGQIPNAPDPTTQDPGYNPNDPSAGTDNPGDFTGE